MISIILPTYNRAYILGRAINSVLRQTYEDWELIVVDDASQDNTQEFIKSLTDDRIHYLRNKCNKGANFARNLGIKASSGEYIAFIDSDNAWTNNKLEKQLIQINQSESDIMMVFCRGKIVDGNRIYTIPDVHYNNNYLTEILIKKNVIDTNTVLIRRECFEKVGFFDENMSRLQDWEMFFRVAVIANYKILYEEEILNTNYILQDSISKDGKKYINAIFYFAEKYWYILNNSAVLYDYIKACITVSESDEDFTIISNKLDLFIAKNLINDEDYQYLKDSFMTFKSYKILFHKFIFDTMKEKQNSLYIYLVQQQYKTIGIYGLGKYGEMLYSVLKEDFNILYGIDRNVDKLCEIKIYHSINDVKENVDVIIVTVFFDSEKLCDEIRKIVTCDVISLNRLLG